MKTDLRTVRQAGKVKLAEILKDPENIPVVIEHISELCRVADIAHDLVLDWRDGNKWIRHEAPMDLWEIMDRLDEVLVAIGYLDEQED